MENTRRSRRLRHETPELGLLHPLESPGTQWASFLDPAIADLTVAMKALKCRKDSSADAPHEPRVAAECVAGPSEDYLPLQYPILYRGKFLRSPNSRAMPRSRHAYADMATFADAIHAFDAMHGAYNADDNVLLPENPATDADAVRVMLMDLCLWSLPLEHFAVSRIRHSIRAAAGLTCFRRSD